MRTWRALFGPLDLRMPVDPAPPWNGTQHEDWEDRLNPDLTWGVPDVGSPGGSGIVFGYACDDQAVVEIAAKACHARKSWYDWEHLVRQYRYDIALWEMTKSRQAASRIIEYGEWMHSVWSENGPVHDGPEWVPMNVAQYKMMALKNPRHGLPSSPGLNERALGWCMYLRAMQHKVARTSASWSLYTLDMLDTAAMPFTGQVTYGPNSGGEPLDTEDVEHTDHWSIMAQGALALCHRMGARAPAWVIDGALSIWEMEPLDYGGFPSPPKFTRTQGMKRVPATGKGQGGAPAHGHWGSLCTSLYSMTRDSAWLDRALKYGPYLTYTDEQSRKETMLLRGLLT